MKSLIQASDSRATQNQNHHVKKDFFTQGYNLTSIFQAHGNQFLKFNFVPLLNFKERLALRVTCQTIKKSIPIPQYSYFKTINGDARARIEINLGFVETCGNPPHGGNSSEVSCELQSDVKNIFSSLFAFAALKANGKVITWGSPHYGGDARSVWNELQSGVKNIFSTVDAFAALKTNGRVITWGGPYLGGDSSNVSAYLQSDVESIVSTAGAFAALKRNGQVISWGDPEFGGDSSNNVRSFDLKSEVKTIYSTNWAFAALKENGRVITWGGPDFDGSSSNVSKYLQNGVIQIVTIENKRFCATKCDGTQVHWS